MQTQMELRIVMMWRLLNNQLYDRSHVVIRLAIHLPNEQNVYFAPGHEDAALNRASSLKTTLEAWLSLNSCDEHARQFLYCEIPLHYVFFKRDWKPRQNENRKIITRMYMVSPKDVERFHVRLLLLHCRGVISFAHIRSFGGHVYETFKEAAIARGLLGDDIEWKNCLTEANNMHMPSVLRELFAYIYMCF